MKTKEITYKIISDDYNQKYTTFTLKENETYYLLGANGIGKSTLIKLLGGNSRDWDYDDDFSKYPFDVEFNVSVKRSDLKKELLKIKELTSSELDEVLKEWNETTFKIKYSTWRNATSDENYKRISMRMQEIISDKHQSEIQCKINKLKEKINEILELTGRHSNKLKYWLNEKIERKHYYESGNSIHSIYDKKELVEEIQKLHIAIIQFLKKLSDHETQWLHKEISYRKLNELFVKFSIKFRYLNNYKLSNISGFDEKNKEVTEIVDKITTLTQNPNLASSGRTWPLESAIAELSISFHKNIDLPKKILSYGRQHFANNVNDIAKHFNWIAKDEKLRNQEGLPLSRGQEMIAHAYDLSLQNEKFGKVFDEPFVFLDEAKLPTFKKYINKIKGTKLITTHDKSSIDATELKNTILMFKDSNGKRCILNFDEFSQIADQFSTHEIENQIEHSLLSWAIRHEKEKVLLVEGHTDLCMLKSLVPSGVNILPIGGTLSIDAALSFFSTKFKSLFFLFDIDEAGRLAQLKVRQQTNKKNDLTDKIFNLTQTRN